MPKPAEAFKPEIAKKYKLSKGCGPRVVLPGENFVRDTRKFRKVSDADAVFKVAKEKNVTWFEKV